MGFFGGGGSSVDLASPSPIGSTTPNTGRFTTLTLAPSANTTPFTASGYSLTGANAQSFFDLSGTWNTTGTPTAFKLNVTDTASNASSLLMDLQVGGSSRFSFSKGGTFTASAWILATSEIYAGGSLGSSQFYAGSSGINLGSATFVAWTSGNSLGTKDTYLYRDAANILAQRNATNAQTFRLYNTFTDASNYERGFLSWASNAFRIGTEKLGTGLQRNIEFYTDGNLRMYVTNNAVRLTNNAYLTLGTSGVLPEGGGASDYLLFRNNSGTELGRFQGTGLFSFAGTTSSFPALKRSSAVLQARLADDSGFAQVQGKLTTDTNYTATAPSATGYLTIYDASGTAYKVLCST